MEPDDKFVDHDEIRADGNGHTRGEEPADALGEERDEAVNLRSKRRQDEENHVPVAKRARSSATATPKEVKPKLETPSLSKVKQPGTANSQPKPAPPKISKPAPAASQPRIKQEPASPKQPKIKQEPASPIVQRLLRTGTAARLTDGYDSDPMESHVQGEYLNFLWTTHVHVCTGAPASAGKAGKVAVTYGRHQK